MSRRSAAFIAVAIGGLLAFWLIWCWAYIATINPVPGLLAGVGLKGAGFWAAMLTVDFFVNVVLCLPAAWALWLLGARHVRTHTLLALVTFFVVSAVTVGLPIFSHTAVIAVSFVLLLAALPSSVWLLLRFVDNAPSVP